MTTWFVSFKDGNDRSTWGWAPLGEFDSFKEAHSFLDKWNGYRLPSGEWDGGTWFARRNHFAFIISTYER